MDHQRKCWDCGNIAIHTDNIIPHVNCRECGSQDTRKVREQTVDAWGCLGNTIKVASGSYLDVAKPDPSTIDLHSISSALSKICRFGGHCPQFYSVAEHCVHATVMARDDGLSRDELVAIFMHDATEAYLGDIVKPLKQLLPAYCDLERRMERAIGERFKIDFAQHAAAIKHYDRLMLKAEKIAQWPTDESQWTGFADIEHRPVAFQYWLPQQAQIHFNQLAWEVWIED